MNNVKPTTILGHEFAPMDEHDWDAFAGADDGSLICHLCDGTVLIYSPHSKELTEIYMDGERSIERRWRLYADNGEIVWGDPPAGA